MRIREITLNDLDRVFELLNELYSYNLKYEKFKENYKLKLKDRNSYNIVAVEDNKILGVLTSDIQVKLRREKNQCYVEDLIVDKEYRNQGIGKKLLQHVINYARTNNCEIIKLSSFITNDKAHKFYESNNFVKQSYEFKQYL